MADTNENLSHNEHGQNQNTSGSKIDALLDLVESYDKPENTYEPDEQKEISPQERLAIKERLEANESNHEQELEKIRIMTKTREGLGLLHASFSWPDQVSEFFSTIQDNARIRWEVAETMIYINESMARKKMQELKKAQTETHKKLTNLQREIFLNEKQSDDATPEKKDQLRATSIELEEERDELEKKNEQLEAEKIKTSKELFTRLVAIKWHLESKTQTTPEEKERLEKVSKELDSVYFGVRQLQLENTIIRTPEQSQELEQLRSQQTDSGNAIAEGIYMEAASESIDVKHPIPIEKDKIVREYNGYKALETQTIIDNLKNNEGIPEEEMRRIRDRVTTIRDAFARAGIPEWTMGTLENMIWRHASNNPKMFAQVEPGTDKLKEFPFMAQDLSTKQAFIYYPGGQVEVTRAFHGSGPIGNIPESHGSSLGSKRLEKWFTGGKYRYRLYMKGLEHGINHNDHKRLNRVHEKSGGNTIGCTGLPHAVMARFHSAVSQAGGGFQETFISNGSPVREQLIPGLRNTSGVLQDTFRRPGDSFSNREQMEEFLAAIDRQPLARFMFAFMAPFWIMIAQSKGDKLMEEFWNRILGNEVSEEHKKQADQQSEGRNTRSSGWIQSEYSPSQHPNQTNEQLKESANTIEVRITKDEALQLVSLPPTEQEKRRTLDGKTVIFKVFREWEQKKGDDFSAYNKRFIAIHGTASLPKNEADANPSKLDSSAINTGVKGKLDDAGDRYHAFAYLVSKNGLIFNFFEDEQWHGAVNSGLANENVWIQDFNFHGVAIELSLASISGGVERPNPAQIQATKTLVKHVRSKHDIGRDNVITSADPVRDPQTGRLLTGAHNDDFSDEDRNAWWAPTKQQVRNRLFSGEFFSDSLSRNPKISDDQIIDTIQRNEMGWDINGPDDSELITQNDGEDFPSLGIGHFVWDAGEHGNSFHRMITYIQEKRWVSIDPDIHYITSPEKPDGHHSTWPHRDKIIQLLKETKHDQLAYIKSRLMGFRSDHLNSPVARRNFDYLYGSAPVILLDYVNFKGEGDSSGSDNYGLQNVLETMGPASSSSDAVLRFQKAAIARLHGNRNAADWNRWWDGWTNRIGRYKDYIIVD